MSLRYTGEATMDEPALRDIERWKDKIEVHLDNRQVFFLFFGSAMVACMLFVLGVIVGKRLESRGRAEAPSVEDPLAALDRFGAVGAVPPPASALTFPRALIGANGAKPAVSAARIDKLPKPAERAERTERGPGKPSGATTFATTVAPVVTAPASAPSTATGKRLAALPRPLSTPAAPTAPTSRPATAGGPATAPRGVPSPSSPAARSTVKLAARSTTNAATTPVVASPSKANSAAAADKAKGRFLLQLSSFQDRAEAEAFAHRFASQNAYVVSTELPGKGTWYRVRVGSYVNLQEATAAKSAFEREHSVIAYVAGNGPAR